MMAPNTNPYSRFIFTFILCAIPLFRAQPSAKPSIKPKAPTRIPSLVFTSGGSQFPSAVKTSRPSIRPRRRPTAIPSASSKQPFRPSATPLNVPSSVKPTLHPSATPKSSAPKASSNKPTAATIAPSIIASSLKTEWSSQGGNLQNTRNVDSSETRVRASNIGINLGSPSFFWETGGSVQSAPGIFGDYVIFATALNGNLTCYSKTSGKLIWQKFLKTFYSSTSGNVFARASPVFYDGTSFFLGMYFPGEVLKLSITTGALQGRVLLSSFPNAIVLQSGTIYKDTYMVGVASFEEGQAANNNYVCCLFVGTFHSINAKTMAILWTWRGIPLTQSGLARDLKLSGAPIWGSSPAVDADAGIVYIATGNNYNENQILVNCTLLYPNPADWEINCHQNYFPENWFNSVIAINMTTGVTIWGRRMSAWDSWNYACRIIPKGKNCPPNAGIDADFGMAPALSTLKDGVTKVLYVAQKSGISFCLNAKDGSMIWSFQSSPGGQYGGHNWGISVDDKHVYVSIINMNHDYWILKNGSSVSGGGWAALNKDTGKYVWTTSNPAAYDLPPGGTWSSPAANGRALTSYGASPPLSIGDIVLVGSTDCVFQGGLSLFNPIYGSGGYVYALEKSSGNILSSFETKASVFSGFSADSGCVFVGSGGNKGRGFSVGKGVFGWCI